MEPWELVGYRLLNDSTITAEVAQRIYHGVRPLKDTDYPCLNFFQIVPFGDTFLDTRGAVQNPRYQISVRAKTPGKAMEIARLVGISFHNLTGSINGFDVDISKQLPMGTQIPEDDGRIIMVPVEIIFVFEDTTVS